MWSKLSRRERSELMKALWARKLPSHKEQFRERVREVARRRYEGFDIGGAAEIDGSCTAKTVARAYRHPFTESRRAAPAEARVYAVV
jgi:hypothetical protein